MGRVQRLDPEHGIHHVYSRGTRRWTLFIDQADYERFLMRLAAVCMRYGVRVYAYCLMGNHFHLVVYCPEGQLSAAMRDLKSVYARAHNDRHGFSGPLFESRFGSKIVMSYEYLQVLIRYVHRNPLSIDPRESLANYRWSSHLHYLDPQGARPEWLDIEFPRSFFGERRSYQRFVEANAESDETLAINGSGNQPLDARSLPCRASISAIMLTVAKCAKRGVVEIRPRQRNGLIGLVILIASDHSDYSAAELADACGFASAQGVRNAKAATRARLASDADLRAVLDSVIAALGMN